MTNLLLSIAKAEERIRGHVLVTPLLESRVLSRSEGRVYLKMESEQLTGSFKVRGSMNKVLSLTTSQRALGVVTASTGNHGLGVAYASMKAGIKALVFVPTYADKSKVQAIQGYGAEIRYLPGGLSETRAHAYAKQFALKENMMWVSPYNDESVIAGQGTIGVELLNQLKSIDYVLVTVGGGGMIAGIATYLKTHSPSTKIIGCQPTNSAEMYHSVKAGEFKHMESLPTISDGSAGGFEEGSITFSLCQQLVDDWIVVTEKEIQAAMRLMFDNHHKLIEGAAGVAVAAYTQQRAIFKNATIAIVICGSNIATETVRELLL